MVARNFMCSGGIRLKSVLPSPFPPPRSRRQIRVMDASAVVVEPPATIYQTELRDGKQDTSTPCTVVFVPSAQARAAFTAAQRAGTPLSSVLYGGIRRFDLTELQVFNEEDGAVMGLRLPQVCGVVCPCISLWGKGGGAVVLCDVCVGNGAVSALVARSLA